jgi:hypothetical protein
MAGPSSVTLDIAGPAGQWGHIGLEILDSGFYGYDKKDFCLL